MYLRFGHQTFGHFFFQRGTLGCLELETYLNLCGYKLTTLFYHLALGEKKTGEIRICRAAQSCGLAGAGASFPPPTPLP